MSTVDFLSHMTNVFATFETIFCVDKVDNFKNLEILQLTISNLGKLKLESMQKLNKFELELSRTLTKILKTIKPIQKIIRKRSYTIIDLAKYEKEFNKLKSTKDLTPKEYKRMFEIQNRVENSKAINKRYDEHLIMELPLFIMINDKIVTQLAYIIFNFVYDFYKMMQLAVEPLATYYPDFENSQEYMNTIALNLSSSQRAVADKIDYLKIVNFRRNNYNELSMRIATLEKFGKALYDFKGFKQGDLSFRKGESVRVIKRNNDGWWEGVNVKSGKVGLFPYNYFSFN